MMPAFRLIGLLSVGCAERCRDRGFLRKAA